MYHLLFLPLLYHYPGVDQPYLLGGEPEMDGAHCQLLPALENPKLPACLVALCL